MKKLIQGVIILMVFLEVIGCKVLFLPEPSPKKITEENLAAQIKPGITTQEQIAHYFGEPYERRVSSTGDAEWFYIGAQTTSIFVFPTIRGGTWRTLTVHFDDKGIVKDYSTGAEMKKLNGDFPKPNLEK